MAVGGFLKQFLDGNWKPLAFKGRRFHICTDHKPLTFALASSSERSTPRQQRHLAFIAEYTTDVHHVHGRDNALADSLSCVELATHSVCMAAGLPSLDLLSMEQAQQADAEVQAYRTAITGLVLTDVPLPGTDTTLLCDTSTGAARPIVPRSWRRAVFDAIHSLAHPGIKTSWKMVTHPSTSTSNPTHHAATINVSQASSTTGTPTSPQASPPELR